MLELLRHSFALFTMAVLVFEGCQKEQPNYIEVYEPEVNIGYFGDKFDYIPGANVSSFQDLKVTCSENWCRYYYESSDGNEVYGLEIDENKTIYQRDCKVSLSLGNLTGELVIHQNGCEPMLRIAETYATLTNVEQDYTLSIITNVDCAIIPDTETPDCMDWVSIKEIQKTSDGCDITLHINSNDGDNDRWAKLRIIGEGTDFRIPYYIEQWCLPYLWVNATDYSVSSEKQSIDILFETNSESYISISTDDDWITLSKKNNKIDESGHYSQIVTVAQNTSESQRTGHININLDRHITIRRQISISQTGYKEPAASDAVDLGLSVYWSNKNVGASKPSEVGVRAKWGDPTGNAPGTNGHSPYGRTLNDGTSISGDSWFDIATNYLGNGWRLPTKTECQELLDSCMWTEVTIDGVAGMKASRNGNEIFFPFKDTSSTRGYYWTATAGGFENMGDYGIHCYAYYMDLYHRPRVIDTYVQYSYFMFRPVKNKNK